MIEVTDEMQQFFENELWDIEYNHPRWKHQRDRVIKRIIELHEANKPKPEPVAYKICNPAGCVLVESKRQAEKLASEYGDGTYQPLYTAPPTRKPLSDDEMPVGRMAVNGVMLSPDCTTAFILGVRFAEHKHGIGLNNA